MSWSNFLTLAAALKYEAERILSPLTFSVSASSTSMLWMRSLLDPVAIGSLPEAAAAEGAASDPGSTPFFGDAAGAAPFFFAPP